MSEINLHLGDCIEVMETMPDHSIDAVVTDPPYELGFMGKAWDASGIAYSVEMWREVLRVLKPGGHLLAFGGTRTYHRMACAIEDAGFEVRDMVNWLYGQGFPKSFDISKGIDKVLGMEKSRTFKSKNPADRPCNYTKGETSTGWKSGIRPDKTNPYTQEAKSWDSWGTALKPSQEPVCLARKPISEKNIALNVLKWGTGGLNIDACRIELNGEIVPINKLENWSGFGQEIRPEYEQEINSKGRFPANLILDETAAEILDEQSGILKSGNLNIGHKRGNGTGNSWAGGGGIINANYGGDKGGASRFFYCAKASKSERNAGLGDLEDREIHTFQTGNGASGKPSSLSQGRNTIYKNHHPTVKPISLMRYLCRLITPSDGKVLDPFMGSGTTGCACMMEGFDFVGIEQESEYVEIAEKRIEEAKQNVQQVS